MSQVMSSPFRYLGIIALFAAAQDYYAAADTFLSPLQYGNASVAALPKTGRGSNNTIGFSKAPGFAGFGKRQEECDPGYIPCGIGQWCHPPGTVCCSDGEHNCPEADRCCLSTSQCADPGYDCCANREYTCPTGGTCCPTGDLNCAPPGGVCCGEESCLEGEKCCNDAHCVPGSSVCCGTGYCNEGQTCCGEGLGCADEGYVCCKDQKASCPQGDQCCEDDDGPYCGQPNCLPTLKFPHVPGVTDELQQNTCEGLRAFLKKNGGVNEFDWNGPGTSKTTSQQRRAAGCGGGLSCPSGQNCDEFPMASTKQGGAGATINCVPSWLNGFYGQVWNDFLREESKNYVNQVKFRIKVEDCDLSDLTAKVKRTSSINTNSIVLSSDNNGVVIFNGSWFGNSTQGSNVVFIPLSPDDSNTGTYSFNYALSGGQEISSGWVTDEYGYPYETLGTLKSGGSNTTTFQLEYADAGPVYFYGWTKATDVQHVQMNFTVQAPPPSSTTSSTLLPTGTTTGPVTATKTSAASAIYTSNKLWLLTFLFAFI